MKSLTAKQSKAKQSRHKTKAKQNEFSTIDSYPKQRKKISFVQERHKSCYYIKSRINGEILLLTFLIICLIKIGSLIIFSKIKNLLLRGKLRFSIDKDTAFLNFLHNYLMDLVMDIHQFETRDKDKLVEILSKKIPGIQSKNVVFLKKMIILFFYDYLFAKKEIVIAFVDKVSSNMEEVYMRICFFCSEAFVNDFVGQLLWYDYEKTQELSNSELKIINKW